jgi:uncharacterized protein YajQ (UPF0234 family)
MASFDLTGKLDTMELTNALTQAEKIFKSRFDFKGSEASCEYKEKESILEIKAEDDTKVKAVWDIVKTCMGKRGMGLKGIKESPIEPTGMKMKKMTVTLKSGIDKDVQKVISRLIKESGFKGKNQYMDEKYRLESKSIDELQSLYHFLKTHKDVEVELQIENMKR